MIRFRWSKRNVWYWTAFT